MEEGEEHKEKDSYCFSPLRAVFCALRSRWLRCDWLFSVDQASFRSRHSLPQCSRGAPPTGSIQADGRRLIDVRSVSRISSDAKRECTPWGTFRDAR